MGTTILVGSREITLGGLIAVNGEVFGLTIAHPFEGSSIIERCGVGKIGSLREKGDLWAVCTLDDQSNIPNSGVANPKRIREEVQVSATVLVCTATGVVRGTILEGHSLVTPPGIRAWHKMWMVKLERPLSTNDAGSWVVDAIEGDLYGHIALRKGEDWTIFYVARAQDVSSDICTKLGVGSVSFFL